MKELSTRFLIPGLFSKHELVKFNPILVANKCLDSAHDSGGIPSHLISPAEPLHIRETLNFPGAGNFRRKNEAS
jgi:hypothetical protein